MQRLLQRIDRTAEEYIIHKAFPERGFHGYRYARRMPYQWGQESASGDHAGAA